VQLALLGTLVRRKLSSKFRVFFNYTIFSCVTVVFVLAVGRLLSDKQYFFVYWAISAVNMLLSFLVLYEVLVNLLKPYSALIDFGKILFGWAAGFLVLASTLTAVATSGHQADKICAAVLLFERSIQLMQCGLLLLFVVFQNRLGLSWRSHGICIAIGMGVFAALDLISEVVRSKSPYLAPLLDNIGTFLFLVNWSFWLGAFILPQPQRSTAQDSPQRLTLQRWNEALAGYGYGSASAPSTVESFLPGIERTVDRVMARRVIQ
jgi:hypothetical protein